MYMSTSQICYVVFPQLYCAYNKILKAENMYLIYIYVCVDIDIYIIFKKFKLCIKNE